MDYNVLLYYKYIPVADPDSVRDWQEALCASLNLFGRIIVAPEGINGTVSGLIADTEAYMKAMQEYPLFKGIEFKIDQYPGHTFNKLNVRVKPEIVHFGLGNLGINSDKTANYVEPEEWRQMMKEQPEDVVIFDARSSYETNVGRFKGAIDLNLDNFRDLPEKAAELEQYKGKKIYTYCTGGIKCEKVSVFLEKLGFEEVRQLHGGIIRYANEVGGEDFEGSCYVFDHRVVVPVNKVNPTPVGKCEVCQGQTERMINCANPDCNKHFLICDSCAEQLEGTCSEACHANPHRRHWDGKGYYLRGVNSKLYLDNPDPNYVRTNPELAGG
ncbi:MAG: rhodanese-related sulfurtransferase [Bacteroidia bacterium]|nr:rhodanese-related sulfurtransferase [Bacteroidia bacterium]